MLQSLEEAAWHAWVAKGRVQNRRRRATQLNAAKWFSVAGFAIVAGLWSHFPPYEVLVRWLVSAGALFLVFQAMQSRRFLASTVFGALALLFSPWAPASVFAGNWQRYAVAACAIPFAASLAWRNARPACID